MSLNTTISLRPAGLSDWPAISALLQANKLPTEGACEHLATYLLAVNQGEIVGCAGAEVYGDVGLLRSVAVVPGLQRQGISQVLVSRLLDEAGRRQISKVYLLTMTAPEYFARYSFKREAIEQAPVALKASAEFQGACPDCAAFMSLTLAEPVASTALEGLPVAVIGAGPVGLAAAARLIERGIDPIVLEATASVGANLLDYGHVRLFSPWRYNIDPAMAAQLEAGGWRSPPLDELPLAREVVERVLRPYVKLPAVARALRLNTRVQAISREGFDKVKTTGRDSAPFVIQMMQDGQAVELRARAVIDASGTWSTPNPLGANGLPALGEIENAAGIFYGIPDVLDRDRSRYAGKRMLVVEAGHSAANALLALAELAASSPGTKLAWAVRSPALTRVFDGGDADALPARGQLGTAFRALRDGGKMEFSSGSRVTAVRREDNSLTTVRPHGHRELAHPEKGFYTLGVKSYGRAPTFLMATGFEQARSVVAAIAGDLEAADRVELELPETGVCSIDAADGIESGSACCSTGQTAQPQVAVPLASEGAKAVASACGPSSCGAPVPVEKPVAQTVVRCCD